MKGNKSAEERRRLLRAIFGHIQALPEKQIKECVILVSYTDDHAFAFQKITGRERIQSDRYPYLFPLEDGVRLMDPTITFLKPQLDVNFITMHYVMSLVQRAKFVFVFNASETQEMPFDNIKKMLMQFISLFQLTPDALTRLTDSCALLITDAAHPVSVYAERLAGKKYDQNLLEDGYLPREYDNVKKLVRGVLQKQRVLLCNAKEKALITSEFLTFVQSLKYFELQGCVSLSLHSAYDEFVGCKIYKLWEEVFKGIYSNLDAFVTEKDQQRMQEKEVMKLIKEFDRSRSEEDRPEQLPKREFKSIKLLRVLSSMIQLIMRFIKNQFANSFSAEGNQAVVSQLLETLYSSGFIKNPFIRSFLMNYFLIRRFLSKTTPEQIDSDDHDLFHRVSFIQIVGNTDIFHPKMREISVALLRELESDLSPIDKTYPVGECMGLLNGILEYREVREFTFFTDRVTKKLLKYRANIAYSLIKQSQKNKKDHLRSELNFLRWSAESRLIKDKLKTEILVDIALSLADHPKLVTLALEVLQMLPEYEIYQHVKFIYEKQLRLNVEVLKYLTEEERRELLHTHFQGYYTFFLKIGFQETVREMSMECLRLSDNEDDREFFKNALVKARGNGFRDLHNSFLESSILQEKEVLLTADFIGHIEEVMRQNGLI